MPSFTIRWQGLQSTMPGSFKASKLPIFHFKVASIQSLQSFKASKLPIALNGNYLQLISGGFVSAAPICWCGSLHETGQAKFEAPLMIGPKIQKSWKCYVLVAHILKSNIRPESIRIIPQSFWSIKNLQAWQKQRMNYCFHFPFVKRQGLCPEALFTSTTYLANATRFLPT